MTDYDNLIQAHRILLSSSCGEFTRKMFHHLYHTPYIVGKHHELIFNALDQVVRGEVRKLIINIAPRYGKTLLCSQMFIAYGLAINPESKFLHLSYSGHLTQENSMAVKDIIYSDYYQSVFSTRIQFGSNTKAKWSTTAGGGMYATSTLGQITGFGAGRVETEDEEEANIDQYTAIFNPDKFSGAIVIDDPLKPDDAISDTVRESVNRRFETTIRNRVNSRKTPIVIIMQRLHEHDLCGYLQEIEPDDWTVLSIPAIMTDSYGKEHALWEFKHTLEELYKIKAANSFVFETQYMQNPTPLEGLMYSHFRYYDSLPVEKGKRKCYIDTADTGSDYLCAICYVEYDFGMYILDVLYTKEPMEYTEPETARMLYFNHIDYVVIESNNGGRGFARNVERNLRSMGNKKTRIRWFSQNLNKIVRIFTHSAEVENLIFFPSFADKRWPIFMNDIKYFRKEGRNLHDDGPDALTGMTENFGKGNTLYSDEELADEFNG